jgi:SAM-dependent methyltransferase
MTTFTAPPSRPSQPAPQCESIPVCPVCGCDDVDRSWQHSDLLYGIPGNYTYVRCVACATVYQNPRVVVDDLPSCYPQLYYTHAALPVACGPTCQRKERFRDRLRRAVLHCADDRPASDLSGGIKFAGHCLATIPMLRRRARFGLLDALSPPGSAGRCLEVGPGQGAALAALAYLGWKPIGLEMDPLAAETARRISGCPVQVGTLCSCAFPAGQFQMIYMSHVLEHLPDLVPSLQRCKELLSAGGRLVLIYPNPESLLVRRYGRFSSNWDAPRHLVLPPRGAIISLLKRLGFDRVAATSSAVAAPGLRAVARGHRTQRYGRGPTLGDRLFALWEHSLVALGAPVGEEIVVVADRS